MRILDTIQTKEKLNTVVAVDDIGPGGANHRYEIYANPVEKDSILVGTIQLQCGPRKEENSKQGVIDTDLLEIVRDRLVAFQAGPFSSEYNAEALRGVLIALEALNRRVEDRIARNVLGKNEK